MNAATRALFQLHAAQTRAIIARADAYEARLRRGAFRIGSHRVDPAILLGLLASLASLGVAFARIGGAL